MKSKIVGKITVDILPKKAEDCPLSNYWAMTDKTECIIIPGMYSRCNLELGIECPYLTVKESEDL